MRYVVRGAKPCDLSYKHPVYRAKNRRLIYLHSEVVRVRYTVWRPGFTIDHRDRDGTNNSYLHNLRLVPMALNIHNANRHRPESILPRGVKMTPYGKYVANTKAGGKFVYLGTFDTPEFAGEAYLAYMRNRFGEAHS